MFLFHDGVLDLKWSSLYIIILLLIRTIYKNVLTKKHYLVQVRINIDVYSHIVQTHK